MNFAKWAQNSAAPTQAGMLNSKFWFRGGKISFQLRNNSSQPHVCTKYTVKLRKDIPLKQADGSAFPSLTGDNPGFIQKCFTEGIGENKMGQAVSAPTYSDIGILPTDSAIFPKYFKIVRAKQKTMAPGEIWRWKVKYKGTKWPMSLDDVMQLTASTDTQLQYGYQRKFNPWLYLFRCHGEIGTGFDSGVGTTSSGMLLETIRRFKLSMIIDNSPAVGIWDTNPYNAVGGVHAYNPIPAAEQP